MWNFKQWVDKEAVGREFKGISQLLNWNNLSWGPLHAQVNTDPQRTFYNRGMSFNLKIVAYEFWIFNSKELERHTNA